MIKDIQKAIDKLNLTKTEAIYSKSFPIDFIDPQTNLHYKIAVFEYNEFDPIGIITFYRFKPEELHPSVDPHSEDCDMSTFYNTRNLAELNPTDPEKTLKRFQEFLEKIYKV